MNPPSTVRTPPVTNDAWLDSRKTASSATLSFTYARSGDSGGSVTLSVSADGGATWSDLQSYRVGGSQSPLPQTFDLQAFVPSQLQIRFLGSGSTGDDDGYVYFDDVQIKAVP